jgi:predicted deacylase/ketosteroid isomerase-like protein
MHSPLLAMTIILSSVVPAGASGSPAESRTVEVGTARGVAGQTVRGTLKVAEAADGTPVVLPIAIITGRRPGPVAWVQAGVHGDEYGGPRALQDVVRGIDPESMSGTVVAVMITNPPAFRGLQRVNPTLDDLEDMGDAFPGRERFATERIAAAITANVRRVADFFVDLHTGGDRFRQHPFVFYSVTGKVPEARYDALARGFGLSTLWRDTARVFPQDAVTHFSAAGIPAFLVEVGGGQPLDPADLRLQADAVRNFLRAAGILPGTPRIPASHTILTGYRIVTNARGGFFEAAVKAGDRVREGSVLGTITDAYGDVVETLRAPAGSDIVIGVSTYPAAPTGGWVLELGSGLMEMAAENAASPGTVTLPPELTRVLTDYEAAWRARDGAALALLFDPDGWVLARGHSPVHGRDAIARFYAEAGGPLALRAFASATDGNVGYILGGYAGNAGQPDDGKFTLTLRRGSDGRWWIVSDMDNGNRRER